MYFKISPPPYPSMGGNVNGNNVEYLSVFLRLWVKTDARLLRWKGREGDGREGKRRVGKGMERDREGDEKERKRIL